MVRCKRANTQTRATKSKANRIGIESNQIGVNVDVTRKTHKHTSDKVKCTKLYSILTENINNISSIKANTTTYLTKKRHIDSAKINFMNKYGLLIIHNTQKNR